MSGLPRTSPEEQGIESSAILAFANAVNSPQHEVHSFMLLRHGFVVAEGWWSPYSAAQPHVLFSVSKSFTSTAAGIAIAEGAFSLDDPVIKFFPDELPGSIGDNLAAMRVRHLLSMSTGQAIDTLQTLLTSDNGNWAKAFFSVPVDLAPGSQFLYNSGATYMVSAIIQKTTGQKLIDFLQTRLFEPLGINATHWDVCPDGINTGGWGLKLTSEDIAKLGHLYLQNGQWNADVVLPQGWVSQASSCHVTNGSDPDSDWAQGYGFQFWRCRHGAYRADGAFGQYIVIMPEQDAVLAVTAGARDMGEILTIAWQYLLPAMHLKPLPIDKIAHNELLDALEHLKLPIPMGAASSPRAREISGLEYRLSSNELGFESITLDFGENDSTVTICQKAGRHVIRFGHCKWIRSLTSLPVRPAGEWFLLEDNQTPLHAIAAALAWKAHDTLVLQVRYIETPFTCTYTFQFDGRRLVVNSEMQVSFGPGEGPRLEGYC